MFKRTLGLRGRRALLPLVGTLLIVALTVPALGAAARGRGQDKVLEFETMAPVTGQFVGTGLIRGIVGGGLPWVIGSAEGELSANGELQVRVRGLVIDPANPTAIQLHLAGINPVPTFKVLVSCLTPTGDPNGTVVSGGTFPASRTGNMEAETHVTLPSSCIAPLIFVTSPGNAWFAVTGFAN